MRYRIYTNIEDFKEVQNRTHRKRRINKKWHKRYGTNLTGLKGYAFWYALALTKGATDEQAHEYATKETTPPGFLKLIYEANGYHYQTFEGNFKIGDNPFEGL